MRQSQIEYKDCRAVVCLSILFSFFFLLVPCLGSPFFSSSPFYRVLESGNIRIAGCGSINAEMNMCTGTGPAWFGSGNRKMLVIFLGTAAVRGVDWS